MLTRLRAGSPTGPTAPALLAVVLLAAATGDALAQIPEKFTNLQVLPEDISRGELVGLMRGFAGSLGVRCNHCHVGPENLQGMDFATDEKPAKRTARTMMKMVSEINGSLLKGIETDRTRRVEVQCQTCHHGLTVPEPIEDLIAHRVESDGVEAAIEAYRGLREEHYGAGAYDFSQKPLNSLAERLAKQEKLDASLALLNMNIELHPDDSYTRMLHGGLLKALGRTDEAAAAFRKAIELDPDNKWARKQLAALQQGAGETTGN